MKMRIAKILALAALLLAALNAAEALTWKQAVAEALQNNPSLRSDNAAAQEAERAVLAADSGLWPSLDLGAGLNRNGSRLLDSQYQPGLESDSSSYSGSLSANWNLFNGFATMAGRNQALQALAKARANLAASSSSLRLSLNQAFYQLLYDEKNTQLLKDIGLRYHKDSQYQELVFKSGRTARWTFLKAQSDEAELLWQISQNEHGLEADKAALAVQLGRDPAAATELSLEGDLLAQAPPKDPLAAMQALDRHPSLLAQKASLSSAESGLTKSESTRYPSLSAGGSYGYSGGDTWGPDTQSWKASLSLGFNLFSGFADEAAIAQARLALQAASLDLESLRAQLKASLLKAWASYASAYEHLPVVQSAAEAGNDRYRTVLSLYGSGLAQFLDYEQAEGIYSQAQQQQLRAGLSAVEAQAQYENALGLGLEEALAGANP